MLNPRFMIAGLVVILVVQLTGLSCIDEWAEGLSQISGVPYQQDGLQIDRHQAPIDDGCPCHLAFLYNPYSAPEVSSPAELLYVSLPPALALHRPFIPFHPPLTLL